MRGVLGPQVIFLGTCTKHQSHRGEGLVGRGLVTHTLSRPLYFLFSFLLRLRQYGRLQKMTDRDSGPHTLNTLCLGSKNEDLSHFFNVFFFDLLFNLLGVFIGKDINALKDLWLASIAIQLPEISALGKTKIWAFSSYSLLYSFSWTAFSASCFFFFSPFFQSARLTPLCRKGKIYDTFWPIAMARYMTGLTFICSVFFFIIYLLFWSN